VIDPDTSGSRERQTLNLLGLLAKSMLLLWLVQIRRPRISLP